MPKILTRQQIDQYPETGFNAPFEVMSVDQAGAFTERYRDSQRRLGVALQDTVPPGGRRVLGKSYSMLIRGDGM